MSKVNFSVHKFCLVAIGRLVKRFCVMRDWPKNRRVIVKRCSVVTVSECGVFPWTPGTNLQCFLLPQNILVLRVFSLVFTLKSAGSFYIWENYNKYTITINISTFFLYWLWLAYFPITDHGSCSMRNFIIRYLSTKTYEKTREILG